MRRRDRQTDGRMDGRQTVTIRFPPSMTKEYGINSYVYPSVEIPTVRFHSSAADVLDLLLYHAFMVCVRPILEYFSRLESCLYR